MRIFKMVLILLVFGAFTAFGRMKALELKKRVEKLNGAVNSLVELKQRIAIIGQEVESAVSETIEKEVYIKLENRKYICLDLNLACEDKRILNEFFSKLGCGFRESECERIDLCTELLRGQLRRATDEYNQKFKVWQTAGVCIGLVAGIMIV